MPEETLFEQEHMRRRSEIAVYLQELAQKLAGSGEVRLESAGQSLDLQVPDEAELEVEVERETSDSGSELELEIEISWPEQD